MAKLKAPEGATGCSHGGQEYEVDAKTGTVEVPDEAVAELIHHGFTVAPAKVEAQQKGGK